MSDLAKAEQIIEDCEIIYEEEKAPEPWIQRELFYDKDLPLPEDDDERLSEAKHIGSFMVPSPLMRLKTPSSVSSRNDDRSEDGKISPVPSLDRSIKSEHKDSKSTSGMSNSKTNSSESLPQLVLDSTTYLPENASMSQVINGELKQDGLKEDHFNLKSGQAGNLRGDIGLAEILPNKESILSEASKNVTNQNYDLKMKSVERNFEAQKLEKGLNEDFSDLSLNSNEIIEPIDSSNISERTLKYSDIEVKSFEKESFKAVPIGTSAVTVGSSTIVPLVAIGTASAILSGLPGKEKGASAPPHIESLENYQKIDFNHADENLSAQGPSLDNHMVNDAYQVNKDENATEENMPTVSSLDATLNDLNTTSSISEVIEKSSNSIGDVNLEKNVKSLNEDVDLFMEKNQVSDEISDKILLEPHEKFISFSSSNEQNPYNSQNEQNQNVSYENDNQVKNVRKEEENIPLSQSINTSHENTEVDETIAISGHDSVLETDMIIRQEADIESGGSKSQIADEELSSNVKLSLGLAADVASYAVGSSVKSMGGTELSMTKDIEALNSIPPSKNSREALKTLHNETDLLQDRQSNFFDTENVDRTDSVEQSTIKQFSNSEYDETDLLDNRQSNLFVTENADNKADFAEQSTIQQFSNSEDDETDLPDSKQTSLLDNENADKTDSVEQSTIKQFSNSENDETDLLESKKTNFVNSENADNKADSVEQSPIKQFSTSGNNETDSTQAEFDRTRQEPDKNVTENLKPEFKDQDSQIPLGLAQIESSKGPNELDSNNNLDEDDGNFDHLSMSRIKPELVSPLEQQDALQLGAYDDSVCESKVTLLKAKCRNAEELLKQLSAIIKEMNNDINDLTLENNKKSLRIKTLEDALQEKSKK